MGTTILPTKGRLPKDEVVFFPDEFTAARDKNDRLAAILVSTDVNRRDIVTIERLEVRASGWRITYRR
jgi:hypothetical protein